jgi:hypothetical protein
VRLPLHSLGPLRRADGTGSGGSAAGGGSLTGAGRLLSSSLRVASVALSGRDMVHLRFASEMLAAPGP